jgi:hypothetical protein
LSRRIRQLEAMTGRSGDRARPEPDDQLSMPVHARERFVAVLPWITRWPDADSSRPLSAGRSTC